MQMKKTAIFLVLAVLILTTPVLAQQTKSAPTPAPQQSQQPAPTIASVVDLESGDM
jgi:hypothetical protein